MGALKKGVGLSFGLMNTAVSVWTGTEAKVSNASLCTGTTGHEEHAPVKIKQLRHCDTCAKCEDKDHKDADCSVVAHTEIKKGRPAGDGFVILEAEELKNANVDAEKHKKAAALTPHPAEHVEANTVPGEKLYYLTPDAGHEQSYAIIRHLVQSHPELSFMALWTPRTSVGVFEVKARGDVLVFQERVPSTATKALPAVDADAPEAYLTMAETLLNAPGIVTDFDLDQYADQYEAKVQALIASKTVVAGAMPTAVAMDTETPVGTDATLAALQAMLDATNVTKIEDAPKKRAAKKKEKAA